MTFQADAVQHSEVVESGGLLTFTAPREFELALRSEEMAKGVKHLTGRAMKIEVVVGEGAGPASRPAPPSAVADDALSQRALSNAEVQRFRDVFGGQVRQIRNLKE